MRGIQKYTHPPGSCRRGTGRTFGFGRLDAVVAILSCILAPETALADSAVNAATQPYFVIGGAIAALVFLGIGPSILRKAILDRRMAAAAIDWPTTPGTVLSTDVVKRAYDLIDAFDHFVPRIRYEYEADGSVREGDVIRVGLGNSGYLDAKMAGEHLELYPVGSTVWVRYDPHHPEHAVLETEQVSFTRRLLAGSIFAGVGIAAIVFAVCSACVPTA